MTAFWAGLLHPVLIPTHAMAVLGLALLIGRQRWGRTGTTIYAATVPTGLGAIAIGHVPLLAGEGLLAASAVSGLLVALDRPLPRWLVALLAGATGFALALDSPPEAISLREANLTLVGTAIGATVLLIGLVLVTSRPMQGWPRIGVRILGSWIAASAILVSTLYLAR
jgi:hydrogenase/urease accessory protein HupE